MTLDLETIGAVGAVLAFVLALLGGIFLSARRRPVVRPDDVAPDQRDSLELEDRVKEHADAEEDEIRDALDRTDDPEPAGPTLADKINEWGS